MEDIETLQKVKADYKRYLEKYSPETLLSISQLREICREIGCSGVSPNMCQNNPHLCSIIRKLIRIHKP